MLRIASLDAAMLFAETPEMPMHPRVFPEGGAVPPGREVNSPLAGGGIAVNGRMDPGGRSWLESVLRDDVKDPLTVRDIQILVYRWSQKHPESPEPWQRMATWMEMAGNQQDARRARVEAEKRSRASKPE